jgi:hypothetical protein
LRPSVASTAVHRDPLESTDFLEALWRRRDTLPAAEAAGLESVRWRARARARHRDEPKHADPRLPDAHALMADIDLELIAG